MELERAGGNALIITAKKAKIIVDPYLTAVKFKPLSELSLVQLLTQTKFGLSSIEESLVLDCPGEYEILDVSIKGIAAHAYTDAKTDPMRATIYRVDAGGVSLVIVGHINPDLSNEQLESIGVVDVLALPVGNNGYTLDSAGAMKVIREIEPKIVIPTHYAEEGVSYPIPQSGLDSFISELGAPKESTTKLKLKAGSINETLVVYELEKIK